MDLVNDLLDVARIEADHVEINRRPIDVGEAIREVADLMAPRIRRSTKTWAYISRRRCRWRSPIQAACARSWPTW